MVLYVLQYSLEVRDDMKTLWQEYPNGDVSGQWAALYVTMNQKGHITMSRITHERTGAPAAYLMWFD